MADEEVEVIAAVGRAEVAGPQVGLGADAGGAGPLDEQRVDLGQEPVGVDVGIGLIFFARQAVEARRVALAFGVAGLGVGLERVAQLVGGVEEHRADDRARVADVELLEVVAGQSASGELGVIIRRDLRGRRIRSGIREDLTGVRAGAVGALREKNSPVMLTKPLSSNT